MTEIHHLRWTVNFLTERLKKYEPHIEEEIDVYTSQLDRRRKRNWETIPKSFLAKVPSAKDWFRRQYDLALNNADCYSRVVRLMVKHDGRDISIRFGQDHPCLEKNDIEGISEAYAITTKATCETAQFATALCSFRGLILASLCAVLEAYKILPNEKIDEIMRHGLVSRSDTYQFKRMRRAAVFINRLINDLTCFGWTIHRATELFFLCGQSIHQYAKIAHERCREYLLEVLKKERYTHHDFQDCLASAYTIPGIICSLAPGLSAENVRKALHYSTTTAPECIYTVHDRIRLSKSNANTLTIQEWSPPCCIPTSLYSKDLEDLKAIDSRLGLLMQIDKSSETSRLLLILSYLGGYHIPKTVLTQGCLQRRRWNDDGGSKILSPIEAGLEPDLVTLLSNKLILDQTVQTLCSQALISIATRAEGLEFISLDTSLQEKLLRSASPQQKERWIVQALTLICQAFLRGPGSKAFNEQTTRRAHLSHLQQAIEYFGTSYYLSLPEKVKIDFAATLLTASTSPTWIWKMNAVTISKQIIESLPKHFLHIWVSRREVQLASSTPWSLSQVEALEKKMASNSATTNVLNINPRDYAQFVRFLVSNAEKLLQRNEITLAKSMLHRWSPPHNQHHTTTLLQRAHLRWKFAMAKTLRFEGDFYGSEQIFQHILANITCLENMKVENRIFSHIGDVLCELGQFWSALELMESKIECYRALGKTNFAMALSPSAAEALILIGDLPRAQDYLLEASDFFQRLEILDNTEKLAHIRVSIGLAKIDTIREHWDNALRLWADVLGLMRTYQWGEGFTFGMVNLSMSCVTARLGKIDMSQTAERCARGILDKEGWDQYWLAMMATHWRNYLQSLSSCGV